MPTEHPFLTGAAEQGETPAGAVPDALFDLAVNRAAAALRGSTLEAWHARTRFARRIPLADIRAALAQHPGSQYPGSQHPGSQHPGGECHWVGGKKGGWQQGKAAFP